MFKVTIEEIDEVTRTYTVRKGNTVTTVTVKCSHDGTIMHVECLSALQLAAIIALINSGDLKIPEEMSDINIKTYKSFSAKNL